MELWHKSCWWLEVQDQEMVYCVGGWKRNVALSMKGGPFCDSKRWNGIRYWEGSVPAKSMARGELVSSATIMTLIKRHMQLYPGKQVLLDGFPWSLENTHDFLDFCGKPELAFHFRVRVNSN